MNVHLETAFSKLKPNTHYKVIFQCHISVFQYNAATDDFEILLDRSMYEYQF